MQEIYTRCNQIDDKLPIKGITLRKTGTFNRRININLHVSRVRNAGFLFDNNSGEISDMSDYDVTYRDSTERANFLILQQIVAQPDFINFINLIFESEYRVLERSDRFFIGLGDGGNISSHPGATTVIMITQGADSAKISKTVRRLEKNTFLLDTVIP